MPTEIGDSRTARVPQSRIPLSLRKQDWAYQQVRDWILSGTLRPGQRLGQEQLAEDLGISRVPLRHALSRLASEGLVVDRPHQTWVVAEVSADDAKDVYSGRVSLEEMLAMAAARSLTTLDRESRERTLVQLEEILAEQEWASSRGDRRRVNELDRQFHTAIYALAGMPQSLAALQQLRTMSDRYIALYLSDVDRARTSISEHATILSRLRAGDAEGVAAAVRAHVLAGLAVLTEMLKPGERDDRTVREAHRRPPADGRMKDEKALNDGE